MGELGLVFFSQPKEVGNGKLLLKNVAKETAETCPGSGQESRLTGRHIHTIYIKSEIKESQSLLCILRVVGCYGILAILNLKNLRIDNSRKNLMYISPIQLELTA